jgi:glutamate/tyrosine decarboxylase-like PLP-dependent enzyme
LNPAAGGAGWWKPAAAHPEQRIMTEPKSYHMTPDEFRRHGRALVDWIADYYERVESLPVLSQVRPGALREALPPRPPERGESFEAMLRDVDALLMPGITHWQSPNFFAYFPANSSPPAVLGELLSAGLGVQGMLWATSPACTELEAHVLDWLADSYCFNPHKWMFTNFDCDCFYVADRAALIRALSVMPEYLRNRASESGAVVDYRDWQVPLGRRFRWLKLWFVIRHYGVEGLRHHVRRHVELAQGFAQRMREDPRFELAAPALLNLVCFRHVGGDAVNQRLLERLNATGRLYLTHTKLNDRIALRMCIGQTHTDERHVAAAWERICTAAAECERP